MNGMRLILKTLSKNQKHHKIIAAVILEPVLQGAGGCVRIILSI